MIAITKTSASLFALLALTAPACDDEGRSDDGGDDQVCVGGK
jgi:hypothetical protein